MSPLSDDAYSLVDSIVGDYGQYGAKYQDCVTALHVEKVEYHKKIS